MTQAQEKKPFYDSFAWHIAELVFALLVSVVAYISLSQIKKIDELGVGQTQIKESVAQINQNVAVMQANRFTANDGLEMWKQIAEIKTAIAKMPTEIPPKWFIDRIDRMEAKMSAMSDNISELKARAPK